MLYFFKRIICNHKFSKNKFIYSERRGKDNAIIEKHFYFCPRCKCNFSVVEDVKIEKNYYISEKKMKERISNLIAGSFNIIDKSEDLIESLETQGLKNDCEIEIHDLKMAICYLEEILEEYK